MTKNSSQRASADVGFMMTAYNLRRIINILGLDSFRRYLENRNDLFFSKTGVFERILAHMLVYLGKMEYWNPREILSVNRLSLIHITSSSRSF
jgi:hypothetical protein